MLEAIPSYFKQRDRWLLWDSGSDTPRRPHWNGDFQVSWNDPDDWHTFEDAIGAADRVGSWGVGFVVQPDDPVYVLDVDGPFDDEGQPRDWFPGLDPLTDTYTEWSPSGNSLHTAIEGEPPEWWTDCEVGPDVHEGVDVLSNKFCTFTGERVDGAAESVVELDLDPWLTEAYHGITGTLPSVSSDERQEPDAELSEDEIEAALEHVDPDLSHSEWVKIGFAVHDWDSGTRGRRLFSGWSRSGSKWDDDAERTVEWIWQNATQNGGVTVGTLIHYAKQNGWNPPRVAPSGSTSGANLSWDAVRGQFEQGEKYAGRKLAADKLEGVTSWMYVLESGTLWSYQSDSGWYLPWGEQRAARLLESHLGTNYSKRNAEEITERLRNRNQVHRENINAAEADDSLLCVGNGVVNLATGELRDHSPEYKFTRGLRWDYDPERADTGPVLSFLDDVTQREADRDTLLDHLAHGLMPGHPYRAFVMMYGPGGNGKSKVGELFRQFVGEDNAAAVELQDLTGNDDFATGALPGAFVNVGDDVSIGEIRDSSTLKSLTNGATMRANRKHEKKYDFRNEAAMFFSANEPPRIAEESAAIGDRIYPIEMPYRFLGEEERDPDDPMHKRKDPKIVPKLVSDDAAMRGLLSLAVDHAQDLIESDGQYSMPESPTERRRMYEAASDPIHRFAYDYLEPGDGDDMLAKDDVYAVYKNMCADADERTAKANIFKQQMSKQSIVDVEACQTRALSEGESVERAWRYVRFAENAREYMPPRIAERYGKDGEAAATERDDSADTAFGATPLTDAARSLTGYVTVTAEVVSVEEHGDGDTPTTKAILRDESGAMDLVTWNGDLAQTLHRHEGGYVAIQDAEVSEYEGTRQLQGVDGLTRVESIQAGVGHTTGEASEPGQSDLATADGGDVQSLKHRLRRWLSQADAGDVSPARIAGELSGADPQAVEAKLDTLATESRLIERTGDGYRVL